MFKKRQNASERVAPFKIPDLFYPQHHNLVFSFVFKMVRDLCKVEIWPMKASVSFTITEPLRCFQGNHHILLTMSQCTVSQFFIIFFFRHVMYNEIFECSVEEKLKH